MKREIKFRAKDTCGEWHYGDLELPRNEKRSPYIHSYKENGEYDKQYPIDSDTIGQFTGLYDKNGKEIYEGDIIREIDSARAFEVVYEAPEFCMADNIFGYRFLNHPEIFEVIGNIHDNKDSL